MEIEFATNRLERCADDYNTAVREWGSSVARRYQERIGTLLDAPNFNFLREAQALRLHRLAGRRQEQYAIYLIGRWRLIIAQGPGANAVTVQEVSNHYGD